MSRKLLITSMILFGASQVALADEEAFKQLDVDDSGTISAKEAGAIEGLQESMAEFDANGDRELDAGEFAAFIENMDAEPAS